MIIALDFDGTIAYKTEDLTPQELLPCAKEVINWLYNSGHHIIIWTCRTGPKLREAVDFLNKNGIKYHDVNSNAEGLDFQTSNKIFADIYIDDRTLGNEEIDWLQIKQMIENKICQPEKKVVNVEELIKQIVFAKVAQSKSELKKQLGNILGGFAFQVVDSKIGARYKYPGYYGKYDLDEFAEGITEAVKKSKYVKEEQISDVGQRPIEVEFAPKDQKKMVEFIEEKTVKSYLG